MKRKFCSLTLVALIFSYSRGDNLHDDDDVIWQPEKEATSGYHRTSSTLNSSVEKEKLGGSEIWGLYFADGMVSVDCLRCMCLQQSNCEPVGCEMRFSLLQCGYFQITYSIWEDCGELGSDWKKCANDVTCSSQCLQNYMKRYVKANNCLLNCEGYSRELFGGPTGCNNPLTVPYWNALQTVPGCKGVE